MDKNRLHVDEHGRVQLDDELAATIAGGTEVQGDSINILDTTCNSPCNDSCS